MAEFDPIADWTAKKRKEIEEQNAAESWKDPLAGGLASLAAAFQGGNSVEAALSTVDRGQKAGQAKLDAFDKGKANAVSDYQVGRQLKTDGREDAKFDPNSAESKRFRSTLEATLPNIVKQYGADFQNLTAADQDMVFKPAQLRETVDARKQAAAMAAADRSDKRQEKVDMRNLELAVPGYTRTGEVMPKAEEAVKFRKATATSEALANKLTRMRDLVNEKGSFEYGGNAGTEMESLATEIQLLGKSPELYELGVLTGPDLSLLQKITADPTSFDSLFTQDSSRIKQIDTQLKSIRDKLATNAKSMGYQSKAPPVAPPPSDEDSASKMRQARIAELRSKQMGTGLK